MRKILALSIIALVGCAASKPASVAENPVDKCEYLNFISDEQDLLLLKSLIDGVAFIDENNDLVGKCLCVSTITCNETSYCSLEECPWGIFSSLDSIASRVPH